MRAALLLLALGSAAQAQEPSRWLKTIYRIQAAPAPEGERDLAAKEWVVKQPLLPDGLAELTEPVVMKPKKPPVPAGTRLLAVQSEMGEVRCVMDVSKLPYVSMPCLVDADRDGRFESWFGSGADAIAVLPVVDGRMPKTLKPLATPVAYRNIDPALHEPKLFVGVQRRNYFNIYGNEESFMIVYGSEGRTAEITTPVVVKTVDLPKQLSVLGARFTAISETDGKLKVRVDTAMPPQPFGVKITTTYR